MIHDQFKAWGDGQFDVDGDCMQPAELVFRFEHDKLVQEYFVLRSRTGEYCGREILEGC
jgi:hypothetical protein